MTKKKYHKLILEFWGEIEMSKLMKCKSCDNEISKNAKVCPHCGEPVPQKTSALTWLVLIFFIIAIFVNLIPDIKDTTPQTVTNKERTAELERVKEEKIANDVKYFSQSKDVILNDLKIKMQSNKYDDVLKITTKYQELKGKDANISKVHTQAVVLRQKEKKEIQDKILIKLKNIPVSEYAKNKELYQALLTYDPNNKKYQEKVKFYTAKLQKVEEDKRLVGLGLKWNYKKSKDKMGRGIIKNAIVHSMNKLNFGFPYQGLQRASLQLRKHPQYGKDVILNIQKGQFLCRSYNGCKVSVRFDNRKPIAYRATEPSDHSSTTIFINDYNSFLKRAKKSQKIYIEAEFFQEGTRIMEFNSEGLKF